MLYYWRLYYLFSMKKNIAKSTILFLRYANIYTGGM